MLEDVDELLETMRIVEESPNDDEIQPIETFVETESATNSKGFETLYNTIPTSTTNCFALMLKRKLDKFMMNCDDCLRCFNETLIN